MMWQTMLELSDGWDVITPLGRGVVLIVTTPSYLGNSTLYVKLKDGQLKHFDSNDVRICGSPTYGETVLPEIPKTWQSGNAVKTSSREDA
jgi:hypothetical protein